MSLPPDPHALDGLGRNHSIETALADLVDNSIDAGASDVLIRFMQQRGRLCGLYVVDNGRGIRADRVDAAMTVGGSAAYGADSLGKFGLGMKAASFSQARSLTVLSRTADSHVVGRRWRIGDRTDFQCDVVPPDFAHEEIDRSWNLKSSDTGTVIRWDDVTGFPATDDPTRVQGFLTATMTRILDHLGLVMHRLLAEGRINIGIDAEDTDLATAGPRFDVTPLDPFGYQKPGHLDYPKRLTATAHGHAIHFDCHIWPGRSKTRQFQLVGGVVQRQGLYFYRRKRLLHAGGWDGVTVPDPRLQLARVAIDIDDEIIGLFHMNPEKSRVTVGPEFAHLAEQARGEDGTTMADYLRDAEAAYRTSRERSRNRRRMMPPGRGFEPALKGTIADEVPFVEGENPIDIRWRRFEGTDLFTVDRDSRTLWLNDQYRSTVLSGRRGGLNDAPLVKALLYLLVEDVFQGEYLGAKDKDNIALWQEVLTTAVLCEVARSEKE
ncbi:ATP-binding protein [Micromonospora tarensis]|uniref:ATP-binding protein n=1 Tax=Micromonospora tarensis TaxID=2806100 RepID=UPI002815F852|nr:ATP-binding protein [Micromonospora tarensis]